MAHVRCATTGEARGARKGKNALLQLRCVCVCVRARCNCAAPPPPSRILSTNTLTGKCVSYPSEVSLCPHANTHTYAHIHTHALRPPLPRPVPPLHYLEARTRCARWVFPHTYTHTHARTHTHVHTHTHTHTHTNMEVSGVSPFANAPRT